MVGVQPPKRTDADRPFPDDRITVAPRMEGGSPWPVTGRIEATGGSIAAFPVELKPYEVRAFQVPATVKLTGVQAEPPSAATLGHLHQILGDAEKLLANRWLSARVLRTADDRTFVKETIAAAKTAPAGQHPAQAWSLVTQPRCWTLTRTKFELTYRSRKP